MLKYAGYKMAIEDWDTDRFQKENKGDIRPLLSLHL